VLPDRSPGAFRLQGYPILSNFQREIHHVSESGIFWVNDPAEL